MITSIGIIGQGFVGNAVRMKMQKYYDVFAYDKDETKFRNAGSVQSVCALTNIIFVCLPTPMKPNGECDVSILESVLYEINDYGTKKVVIKSTMPPGTTNRFSEKYPNLKIAFNPEFLTEVNAVNDYDIQNRIIIGANNECSIFIELFKKAFPKAVIIVVNPTTAEMVKYVTNTFLATKVSFANEIYQICKALGINYSSVIDAAIYDERLGQSHWQVPGHDGHFGFGGSCFPKDTASLKFEGDKLGVSMKVLNAVIEKNLEVRPERDWEQLKGRAVTQ